MKYVLVYHPENWNAPRPLPVRILHYRNWQDLKKKAPMIAGYPDTHIVLYIDEDSASGMKTQTDVLGFRVQMSEP